MRNFSTPVEGLLHCLQISLKSVALILTFFMHLLQCTIVKMTDVDYMGSDHFRAAHLEEKKFKAVSCDAII